MDSIYDASPLRRKTIPQLNLIRCVAIFLVILQHTAGLYQNAPLYSPLWSFTYFLQSLARVGLALFFILSGYLLVHPYETLHSKLIFYNKRLKRILGLFILWSFFYYIYNKWPESISIIEFLKNILSGPIYGHLWFIYTLIAIYIVTPFISNILVKSQRKDVLIFVAAGFILMTLQKLFTQLNVNQDLLGYFPPCWMLYFILGYAIRLYEDIILLSNKIIFIGVAVLFCFTFAMAPFEVYTQNGRPFLGYFWLYPYDQFFTMALYASAVFIFLLKTQYTTNKIIDFIAKRSYGMILSHLLVMNFYSSTISITNPYINIICFFSFTVVGSAIIEAIFVLGNRVAIMFMNKSYLLFSSK